MSIFSPKYIRNIPMETIMISTLVGILSLVALIAYGLLPRAKKVLGVLLCFTILLHIGWILRYGIFIQERHDQPTFDQMKLQKRATLDYPFTPGEGLFSSVVTTQMDNSFMEPFLGRIYTHVIPVSSREEAYESMSRNRMPHQLFVEYVDPERARAITDKALFMSKGAVNLIYSSFNRLQFRVISEAPAFFALSYPYSGYWNASLNGEQVHIYRANGASHAVEIPEGNSVIEFRYWSPAAFWGIVTSSVIFVGIGLYACFISLGGLRRIIAMVLLLVIGSGFVMLWNYSLYTGDNLGTQYTWHYTPPEPKPVNIAYGKITSGFPVPKGIFYFWFLKGGIYLNHPSRIVDGNKSKGSGFKIYPKGTTSVAVDMDGKVTRLDRSNGSGDDILPKDVHSVIIDFADKKTINSLLMYASALDTSGINCDFEVLTSLDQKDWSSVAFLTPELKYHHPIAVDLVSPQTTRYLQIKVYGSSKVILDEVEVY
jgi:hypothetical protein